MDFIAKLSKYIAELKVIGGADELELADNLQNCVKEYLDDDQTSNFIKQDESLEEGEVMEVGEINAEEEGELTIKEEEEGEILIKDEIWSNEDSQVNMLPKLPKIYKTGFHKHMFKCSDCQKELTSLNRFIDHKRLKHGIADFNEEIKTRCKNLIKNLHEKVEPEHMKPLLSCKYCLFTKIKEPLNQEVKKKISNDVIVFRRHIQNDHITCEVCEIAFNDKLDLTEHMESHNPDEGIYLCNYTGCTRSEKTFSLVFLHAQNVHHAVRLYKCNKCPESFASMTDLTEHFKRHILHRLYSSCPLCPLSYPRWSRLKTHIRKAHKNICNVCERIFQSTSVLFEHMKVHTEKEFINLVCLECNKLFPSLNVLKKHMLSFTHTGTKYFSCELCKKGFSSKNSIRRHMQTKGRSRCKMLPKVKYITNCTECGKKSKSHQGWLRHMTLAHSKNTSFSCKTCRNRFPTETALTRHMSRIGKMKCHLLQEIQIKGM